MIERKEYLFENEFVKIINPTMELQRIIAETIKELKAQDKDEVNGIYYVLKKLVIAKDSRYDFSKYTLNQFKEMMEEVELYEGLQQITNAVALATQDIILVDLQMTAMAIKDAKMKALLEVIQNDTNDIMKLNTSIEQSKKEKREVKRISELLKEKNLKPYVMPELTDEDRKRIKDKYTTNG